MRIIAFDFGTRRIGVAVSDPTGTIASAVEVYERTGVPHRDAESLAAIAHREGAERIVVGMPISLQGQKSLAAQQVENFVKLLRKHTATEVVLWDERMTTALAERAMRENGANARERRNSVDQVAATVILQSYLDAQRRPEARGQADATSGVRTKGR